MCCHNKEMMEKRSEALIGYDGATGKPRSSLAKRILVRDLMPLAILVSALVGILLVGGAIFLKLEFDEFDEDE